MEAKNDIKEILNQDLNYKLWIKLEIEISRWMQLNQITIPHEYVKFIRFLITRWAKIKITKEVHIWSRKSHLCTYQIKYRKGIIREQYSNSPPATVSWDDGWEPNSPDPFSVSVEWGRISSRHIPPSYVP